MLQSAMSMVDDPESEKVNSGLIFAFLCLCAILMFAQWIYPRGAYLTVINNPFARDTSISTMLVASDSRLIGQGRFSWIANIYAPHDNSIERLFATGALLVIRNYAPETCFQEVQS